MKAWSLNRDQAFMLRLGNKENANMKNNTDY